MRADVLELLRRGGCWGEEGVGMGWGEKLEIRLSDGVVWGDGAAVRVTRRLGEDS